MEKYKRYLGVIVFAVIAIFVIVFAMQRLMIKYNELQTAKAEVQTVSQTLEQHKNMQNVVQMKMRKLKESVLTSQKKIYSPIEDFGNDKNDTLFFTLYNDVIEMVKSNAIKIKSIDYQYNPNGDKFVEQGTTYFVCDVNMEIVSNYVNLGKLIQDIYQYPYYIKINKIEVLPYPKDKKILLSTISLRLYAHTAPDSNIESDNSQDAPALNGAENPLPQE